MKDRWESVTKTSRIEWTITRDKETKTAKAVWYVIEPQYHSHTWTACAAVIEPGADEISTYGYRLEPIHAQALTRALKMATDWITGRRPRGKKIVPILRESAE